MRIIENPKTKLESVDLIDDNGVLLRITPESLIDFQYDENIDLRSRAFNQLSNLNGTVIPKCRELHFTVMFLDRTLAFRFTGEKDAAKIAESLYKLKGY